MKLDPGVSLTSMEHCKKESVNVRPRYTLRYANVLPKANGLRRVTHLKLSAVGSPCERLGIGIALSLSQ